MFDVFYFEDIDMYYMTPIFKGTISGYTRCISLEMYYRILKRKAHNHEVENATLTNNNKNDRIFVESAFSILFFLACFT